jgi:CheY-like chemotaxis protein
MRSDANNMGICRIFQFMDQGGRNDTGTHGWPIHNSTTVLYVSPNDADAACLARIFHESDWGAYTNSECTLITTATVGSALSVLGAAGIPIVLCDCDLKLGTWREMLDDISLLPDPPLFIVSSRLPDERLWSEALNLGAYDMLAKPYDSAEVIRIVSLAWQHWLDRHGIHNRMTERRKAVGDGSASKHH